MSNRIKKEDFRRRGRDRVMPVYAAGGKGAFGDIVTTELTPKVQADFVYGQNTEAVYEYTLLTGSIAYTNGMVNLSTGATLYGTAYVRTNNVVRYRPGQGALFRFTALFDTPVAGVSQTAGLYGGSENGLFVGYNYADAQQRFGFCHQYSGIREIYTLEVTVASTGAETVTITLNGTAFPITVNSGTLAENAQEIAEQSFTGWTVEADGATVTFLASNVGARAGAYSVSSSGTLDGTMTERAVGAAVTEDWYYQNDWNIDQCDGTGPSAINLDPTKGNVFEIHFQYLGFGAIELHIEDPQTRRFQPVHRIVYANANTVPSVSQPIFSLGAAVSNVTAASDVTVSCASYAGFIEGERRVLGPEHGTDTSGNLGTTTELPIISIRNNETFVDGVSRVNLRDIFPNYISVAASGSNKPLVVRVVKGATLTDPLWTKYDATHSYVSYDTSATAYTGGDLVFSTIIANGTGIVENLGDIELSLRPAQTLTLVLETLGNAADYAASIAWKEDS